jgi:hypothetical protein
MNLTEFFALDRQQQRDTFKTLTAAEQREVMAAMNRQVEEKLERAYDQAKLHYELETSLVPAIQFKKPSPPVEYPTPPLREGLDQEQFVRQVFRADGSIKEIRTADGSIYQRK